MTQKFLLGMMVDYPQSKKNSKINSPLLIFIVQRVMSFNAVNALFAVFFEMNKLFLGTQTKSLKSVLKIVHMTPYSYNVFLKR